MKVWLLQTLRVHVGPDYANDVQERHYVKPMEYPVNPVPGQKVQALEGVTTCFVLEHVCVNIYGAVQLHLEAEAYREADTLAAAHRLMCEDEYRATTGWKHEGVYNISRPVQFSDLLVQKFPNLTGEEQFANSLEGDGLIGPG